MVRSTYKLNINYSIVLSPSQGYTSDDAHISCHPLFMICDDNTSPLSHLQDKVGSDDLEVLVPSKGVESDDF